MGILKKLKDALANGTAQTAPTQEVASNKFSLLPLASAYENMFAQIRPLVDEMKVVRPYGVDRNGAKLALDQTPELAALDYPNESMGWSEFADAMFSTWLTEPELNVHIWRDRRGGVQGYSILPFGCRQRIAGKTRFQVILDGGEAKTFYSDEVMTFRYSRSPRDLDKGVSPAVVSYIWAQIDDLMAQYQRAFFQNGAVPATITFITASTRDKYEAKRNALQNGLKGAHNRDKTVYAWRQMLDDGSTGDELEVKTIQGSNSTLAIKDLNNIVTDRLNKSVGVSNFILGDDSSAKYDNAELSDHQFTKRRVYPALMSFWGQFQHELDRITGGLGYAIDFELEIPELTDRLKTKAETKRAEKEAEELSLTNLITAIQAGSTPLVAVRALGLDDKWIRVADGIYAKTLENGAQTVSTTNVVDGTKNKPKCVTRKTDAYEPTWGEGEARIKLTYDELIKVAKEEMKEDPNINLDETKKKIVNNLREDAQDGVLEQANVLSGLNVGKEAIAEMERIIQDVGSYSLSADLTDTLDRRVGMLVDNYASDVRAKFEEILISAHTTGISEAEMREQLVDSIPTARAETIARSESHSALLGGGYDLDRSMAKKYGLELKLRWYTKNPSACDLCKAMDGETVPIGDAFPDHVFVDGEQYNFEHSEWNNDGLHPNAHPNCTCSYLVIMGEE